MSAPTEPTLYPAQGGESGNAQHTRERWATNENVDDTERVVFIKSVIAGEDPFTISKPIENPATGEGRVVKCNISDPPAGTRIQFRELPDCQNGVPGKRWVFCGDFIPDP